MGVPMVMKRGSFRRGCNSRRLVNSFGASNKGPPGYYIYVYVKLISLKT